jgi:branched-chain amino acid transport system permease protein
VRTSLRSVSPAIPPLALLFILVTTDRYLLGVAVLICIAGLQALSLNYVWGWGGQFSMGQIALSAIAAYASALLVLQYQANVWVALVLATGLTVTVAILLGAVGLRFRGMHFAVITLAFGQVVILGLNNWPAVGGPSGLSIPYSIPSLPVISTLTPTQQYLVLGVSMLAVASILTKLFLNTATGRAITAVRDEELLAAAVGIPAASMKVIAFGLSAIPAAMAGWLYAPYLSYLAPSEFGLEAILAQVGAVVVGGRGYVSGGFVGAVIVFGLPEALRFSGAYRLLAYSILLIVVIIIAPNGAVGLIEAGANKLGSWRRRLRRTEKGALSKASGHSPAPDPIEHVDVIDVRGVFKLYGGVAALSEVTLNLRSTEVVGIIGPNGAGKTTLFDVMSGFARPSRGTVAWNGRDITRLPPHRRARFGLVRTFQHARVFAQETVEENLWSAGYIARGPRERAARIDYLVGQYSLGEWRSSKARSLPYGVGKKLGLALGLMANPSFLLLDEPFAGLGDSERRDLVTSLRAVAGNGVGLVIVEHDLAALASFVDRIVVLNSGRILADGTPSDILTDRDVAVAYFGPRPDPATST